VRLADVGDLIAPISVVVLDVLGRDDQEHEMHIGGGWNSVNLHLANGEKIAIRAHTTAGRCSAAQSEGRSGSTRWMCERRRMSPASIVS
jgi:hypothetical protein